MSGFDQGLLQAASARQLLALEAGKSVWISANAGTGKTEVLTRRMLALLLADGELAPREILALTFTKAGAAEMAARLPKRLEDWARLPDEEIAAKVAELGIEGDAETLAARVRVLAAQVRRAPPMVATIHGLAQQVLGRFAIEAGFPTDFEVLEEGAQKRLLREIQHELLVSVDGALAEHLAVLLDELGETGWQDLTGIMVGAWHKFEALAVKQGGLLGVVERLEEDLRISGSQDLRNAGRPLVPTEEEWAALKRVVAVLPGHGAAEILEGHESGLESAWRSFLLTDKNTARARLFVKAELAVVDEADVAVLASAAARAEAQLVARKVYRGFEVTKSALVWAAAVRGAYMQRKREMGLVDYGDLLDGLERVMGAADNGAAGWVWYGLDRRFKHLVVDEAQDNNPQQDRIVQWLAKSILSGDVGEGGSRTVLAVGDMKQSIFRFQGAVPGLFLDLRETLRAWAPVVEVALTHSFRSGGEILRLVDRVFTGESGPVVMGEVDVDWPEHKAVAAGRPSRVELWETVVEAKEEGVPAWSLPEVRAQAGGHGADIVCFEQIGAWLEQQVGKVVMPSTGKTLSYDDVMLVVQRNKYADMAAGVLRRRGIPVAAGGKVQPQEVDDVVALVRWVFNRGDNLALVEVLKGLRGWTDGMVLGLAQRAGVAVRSFEQAEPVWADFVEGADAGWLAGYAGMVWGAPLELVQRIVTEMGFDGRMFEGLMGWAETVANLRELVMRVELEEVPVVVAGGGVRILTVHGSKGLQAPLVILPDTMAGLGETVRDTVLWGEDVVLFKQGKGLSALEDGLIEEEGQRRVADNLRGLYVAMTRAMDWLVVCGFGAVKETSDTWWTRVREGMGDDVVQGDVFERCEDVRFEGVRERVLPAWVGTEVVRRERDEQSAAQVRGELVHGVLQGVLKTADEDILREVAAVKAAHGWVFAKGGRWEMDVAVNGKVGRVDRVVERDGVWWVIDFKTGEVPVLVPEGYAKQLKGYVSALRASWPERRWQAAVLWTAAARLDEVDVG